jgi:hypothetical protein
MEQIFNLVSAGFGLTLLARNHIIIIKQTPMRKYASCELSELTALGKVRYFIKHFEDQDMRSALTNSTFEELERHRCKQLMIAQESIFEDDRPTYKRRSLVIIFTQTPH